MCVQFNSKNDKDLIMNRIKVLKDKLSESSTRESAWAKNKRTVHAVDNEYYSDESEEYYAGSIQMESHVNSLDHEQLE